MSVMDPGLHEELLAMAAADQGARQRLDCRPRPSQGMSEQELTAAEQIRAVDAANTPRMQAIVQARGWPGRTLVGDDGAQAAWLLVQHADHDPAFQRSAWSCSAVLFRPARRTPDTMPIWPGPTSGRQPL
ncbi:MAG TPA: DUF6624 domain-containing protein [Actinomycetota bacterium]|nr:DUF6624 domain-containing protein [Actinomycetota bacterium]